MILQASEPAPTGYPDAQGILVRTEPVTKYGEVLAATLSSHALSVTNHYIWDVLKCSAHIPASLATAIYHGQFCWPTMFTRGAFSIFLLPPASTTGQLAFRSEEERVQLVLEATVGKCIFTFLAVATAAINHSPILNPRALPDFLSNKLHVNVLVFVQNSPLTAFIHTWSRHTVSHRESYKLLMDANASFCSRLGHIIDMAKQAYLCSCITAASTTMDIDLSVLDHAALHTGIAMGMMPGVAIPASHASIIITSPHPWSPAHPWLATRARPKDRNPRKTPSTVATNRKPRKRHASARPS
jgi:hypothetical protein